jgi:hypothetical protein
MSFNPEEFGASFKGFLDHLSTSKKPQDEPFFVNKLRAHFGAAVASLPVVTQSFAEPDHPNLHVALEEYLAGAGRKFEVIGIAGGQHMFGQGISDLIAPKGAWGGELTEGPVQYANVALDGDRVLACVERGLYLVQDGDERLAVFMRPAGRRPMPENYTVDVMAPEKSQGERFLHNLREAMRARNIYRGCVISLVSEGMRELIVKFHRLSAIERDAIILPQGLLERIERQTVDFGFHSRRLLAAGRHLKRGLLLYGPPGTGKTYTIMYLAGQMRDRTIFLMTGRGLGLVAQTCAMARALQPSIVVLEDVDLIAEERTKGGAGCSTPLLFELLNEMDGLSDDVDVLFLLTTNRPELLEPALAARPGRVDQAIEIPTPDEACRRRLFELYGHGLKLEVADLSRFIVRTEGASAAFIRELLRRAALLAAGEVVAEQIVVTDQHLDNALHDLVIQGGDLTKSLLGFQSRMGFGFRGRMADQ